MKLVYDQINVHKWYIHLIFNGSQLAKLKKSIPDMSLPRDEAVGLKSCNYALKDTIYVNMWNLGQFRENLIFCQ